MKKLSFLLVAISCISQAGNAQTKDFKTISSENVNVIVLESNGLASIQNSNRDQIKISSYLFSKGKIWGFKSPAERPEFEIEYTISEDTLYLSSPDVYSPATIGINTFSERIETKIEIPAEITVIVKQSNQLMINDPFRKIQVLQSDKIIFTNLQKSEIASLICSATKSLFINGISRSQEFEMEGKGKNQIHLKSKDIQINTID